MLRAALAAASITTIAALSGCANAVGCDLRPDEDRCQERTGLQTFGYAQFCDATVGTAVEGGCPDEGKVLGCDLGEQSGGAFFDWYYEPMSRADAEAECADEDGEVIEP